MAFNSIDSPARARVMLRVLISTPIINDFIKPVKASSGAKVRGISTGNAHSF